jgi:hypothetical protein
MPESNPLYWDKTIRACVTCVDQYMPCGATQSGFSCHCRLAGIVQKNQNGNNQPCLVCDPIGNVRTNEYVSNNSEMR